MNLLIIASVNIYQTIKKSILTVMKTCFSAGNLMKQFGNPPFLKEPPFQLTPLFLSNFFMTPLFFQILKTRNPPILGGEETMNDDTQTQKSLIEVTYFFGHTGLYGENRYVSRWNLRLSISSLIITMIQLYARFHCCV